MNPCELSVLVVLTSRGAESGRQRLSRELYSEAREGIVPENPPFYEFMQRYVEHLAATGISLSSVKRYRQILQNFVDFFWVEKGHVKQRSDIATKDIWDYVHCDTSYPAGLLLLIFKSQNGGLFDGETSSEIGSG